MHVDIITATYNAEAVIEEFGRICYQSQDKITDDSSAVFIKNIIKNGHHSVLEHASAGFIAKGVSRSLTHQLVRHRIAVYSQKSQRYVKEGNFEYVVPESIEKNKESYLMYVQAMKNLRQSYNYFTTLGINKEDARYLLPNACMSEIGFTMNFRELLHVIDLRVSKKAQWEIRKLFTEIWKILYKLYSNVFGLTYFEHWSKDYEYKKEIFDSLISNPS